MGKIVKSKKSLSYVISILLLVSFSIVSLNLVYTWYQTFSSEFSANLETDSYHNFQNTQILGFENSNLIFKNLYSDLYIDYINIENYTCLINENFSRGNFQINISTCIENLQEGFYDIEIISSKGLFSKLVYHVFSNENLLDCSILPGEWILVPANIDLGTKDFCVMKYEAKVRTSSLSYLNDSTNMYCGRSSSVDNSTNCVVNGSIKIISKAEYKPLTRLNLYEARKLCENLGEGFQLISNSQWMTIARNIENVTENWHNDNIYTLIDNGGGIKRGNVGTNNDVSYDAILDPVDRSLDFNHTANLKLSNGEEIWDFSGNVWEWTNDTLINPLSNFGKATSTRHEWNTIIGYDDYKPNNTSLNSGYGIGNLNLRISGPAQAVDHPYHGLIRGGDWTNSGFFPSTTHSGGIYALSLWDGPSHTHPQLGFRCTYLPLPKINFNSLDSVYMGDDVILYWNVQNADSCNASGGNWSGSKMISGLEIINLNSYSNYTFELTCTNEYGSTKKNLTVISKFDCYNPKFVGMIGLDSVCNGMLIVNDTMLKSVASILVGGNESFELMGPDSNIYTFEDSLYNIFTGQVRDMSNLFSSTSFNEDIGYWDTSRVISMANMFYDLSSFNQNIENWDVSNVTNMSYMFYGTSSFEGNLRFWCVQNIESKPLDFSTLSPLDTNNRHPPWGICPIKPSFAYHYSFAINQSPSFTIPTHAREGDFMIFIDTAIRAVVLAPSIIPSGWTEILTQTQTVIGLRIKTIVSYKILNSSDPGSIYNGMNPYFENLQSFFILRPSSLVNSYEILNESIIMTDLNPVGITIPELDNSKYFVFGAAYTPTETVVFDRIWYDNYYREISKPGSSVINGFKGFFNGTNNGEEVIVDIDYEPSSLVVLGAFAVNVTFVE